MDKEDKTYKIQIKTPIKIYKLHLKSQDGIQYRLPKLPTPSFHFLNITTIRLPHFQQRQRIRKLLTNTQFRSNHIFQSLFI